MEGSGRNKGYGTALKLIGASVFFTGVLNAMFSFKAGSAIDPLNYIFLVTGAAMAVLPTIVKKAR